MRARTRLPGLGIAANYPPETDDGRAGPMLSPEDLAFRHAGPTLRLRRHLFALKDGAGGKSCNPNDGRAALGRPVIGPFVTPA